jgi:hypothetical protein
VKQFQLGAACNALHPVGARMARWLLHLCDRIDHDVLPLTLAWSRKENGDGTSPPAHLAGS